MKFVDAVGSKGATPSWVAKRKIAELKGWCVKRQFSQCDCPLCKGGADVIDDEDHTVG